MKDFKDSFSKDKQTVGLRLANSALTYTYGYRRLPIKTPHLSAVTTDGNKLILKFTPDSGRLRSKDNKPLTEFELIDRNGSAKKTIAIISGQDTVTLHSTGIEHPAAVRFAWRNTARPNLMSRNGLPVGAFRTQSPYFDIIKQQ